MPYLWTLDICGGLNMARKFCPFKFAVNIYLRDCEKEKCAWWCDWANCCAMVALSSEISDRTHDIMQVMGD